jgi:DNA repair exonuclease SbcCD ATPase subunit
MKFQNLTAENVYSFKHISFDFIYRGTTLIIGKNQDQKTANAAGKSTIFKTVYLGLWGKELVGEPLDMIANRNESNGFLVTLTFEDRGHNYKIVRFRDRKERDPKTGVEFYIDGKPFNGADAPDTQRIIEKKLRISSKLFLSAVMTAQNADKHFLTISDTDKKERFSEILDLTAYSKAFEATKADITAVEERLTQAETKIEGLRASIEEKTEEIKDLEKKDSEFLANKEVETDALKQKIESLATEMSAVEVSRTELETYTAEESKVSAKLVEQKAKRAEFENSVAETKALNELELELSQELSALNEQTKSVESAVKTANEKLVKLNRRHSHPNVLEGKIDALSTASYGIRPFIKVADANTQAITLLANAADDVCREFNKDVTARQTELTNEITAAAKRKADIEEQQDTLKKQIELLKGKKLALEQATKQSAELEAAISESGKELTAIQIKMAAIQNAPVTLVRLAQSKSELEASVELLKNKANPYRDISTITKNKCVSLEDLVLQQKKVTAALDEELVELNFWRAAFSPLGIRSFIFDEVVDLLNQKVQENLSDLFDGALSVIFESESKTKKTSNNKIATKFYLNGKETTYGLLSGGEQRRAILAVNLALTELAEIYSGVVMNIQFLDEPFDGIDGQGQQQAFKLFARLSQNKDGFYIISHDQSFQELCPNVVYIVKENEQSRIVKREEFDLMSKTNNAADPAVNDDDY